MRQLALGIFLFALLAAGLSCRKAPVATHAETHPGEHAHHDHANDTAQLLPAQMGDKLKAILAVFPHPVQAGEETTLLLSIADLKGRMAPGRTVRFALSAPGKAAAPRQLDAAARSEGAYGAEMRFTSKGEWGIRAEVTGSGKPETFVYRVKVE